MLRLVTARQIARVSPTRMSSTGRVIPGKVFFLDPFAARQWDDPQYQGTKISYNKVPPKSINLYKSELKENFVLELHRIYESGSSTLQDGYASFCKHLFVENFIEARTGVVEITEQNRSLLKSGYVKRRPEELAVLTRWFDREDVECPVAKYLDIILYSRDQIIKETESLPPNDKYEIPEAPWGIIGIKAQMESYETPMAPITMMRNALGKEHGGSGIPIDAKEYERSVAYWNNHANVT